EEALDQQKRALEARERSLESERERLEARAAEQARAVEAAQRELEAERVRAGEAEHRARRAETELQTQLDDGQQLRAQLAGMQAEHDADQRDVQLALWLPLRDAESADVARQRAAARLAGGDARSGLLNPAVGYTALPAADGRTLARSLRDDARGSW